MNIDEKNFAELVVDTIKTYEKTIILPTMFSTLEGLVATLIEIEKMPDVNARVLALNYVKQGYHNLANEMMNNKVDVDVILKDVGEKLTEQVKSDILGRDDDDDNCAPTC